MKFWNDASPIVKGAIVIGVVGLLGLGVFRLVADPYEGETTSGSQRGLTAEN